MHTIRKQHENSIHVFQLQSGTPIKQPEWFSIYRAPSYFVSVPVKNIFLPPQLENMCMVRVTAINTLLVAYNWTPDVYIPLNRKKVP